MIKKYRNYFIDEYTFQYVAGQYVNVSGESGTLADFLASIGVFIDERTKLARIEININKQDTLFEFYDYGGKIICKLWNATFTSLQIQYTSQWTACRNERTRVENCTCSRKEIHRRFVR